jgi:phosphoribosylaminoimidazolecarboxamide formyltransferase/IMP cyclohydrolase
MVIREEFTVETQRSLKDCEMKTALLSVWDKTGVVGLGEKLANAGWRLVASGRTAAVLQGAGLKVIPVSDLTGEAEMLGGRVKTLHPAIHAGILARDIEGDKADLRSRGWSMIDLVVANLYPFEQVTSQPDCSEAEAIEHIDIGGVALLRAGAKNFQRVTILSQPEDYPKNLSIFEDPDFRRKMAAKVFARTSAYDTAINKYFSETDTGPKPIELQLFPVQELRYGENPHQEAAFLASSPDSSPLGGRLLGGKTLSYNNLLDLEAAWQGVMAFDDPAVVVLKHASPCGIASARKIVDAVGPAIASDPVSAFGSVISANREVKQDFIEALGDLFVECIAAPGFSKGALDALKDRGSLRALEIPPQIRPETHEIRSIQGGFLQQTIDRGDPKGLGEWLVVSKSKPGDAEMEVLRFAWKAVQPVKSNAVLLAQGTDGVLATVGIGGGQPNRVDCVEIAGKRAGNRAIGSVLASDAFFPFPDGIEAAATLGVCAIIQPGGSRRDAEVIARADELGLEMVFTGVRHFRH